MRNLHKTYYKDYYKNLNFSYLLNSGNEPKAEIKRCNDNLTASELLQQIPKCSLVNQTFELKIAYPGLVTGVGINHEAKIEGEFKLGVHFDWTRGMPVVYGSSVKGALRSAFKDGYVDKSLINQANGKINNNTEKVPEWVGDEANRNVIIHGVFEGKDVEGKNISIYNRDIFFDAVIIAPDSQGRILCSDSITPHGDNPLKNPTPLTFLKIAAGCQMEFRFKLIDSDFGDSKILTAVQKKTLFREILTTVGIGAKTNVGYGQLKAV
jgi:CRISPR-associated protein Cmr6